MSKRSEKGDVNLSPVDKATEVQVDDLRASRAWETPHVAAHLEVASIKHLDLLWPEPLADLTANTLASFKARAATLKEVIKTLKGSVQMWQMKHLTYTEDPSQHTDAWCHVAIMRGPLGLGQLQSFPDNINSWHLLNADPLVIVSRAKQRAPIRHNIITTATVHNSSSWLLLEGWYIRQQSSRCWKESKMGQRRIWLLKKSGLALIARCQNRQSSVCVYELTAVGTWASQLFSPCPPP